MSSASHSLQQCSEHIRISNSPWRRHPYESSFSKYDATGIFRGLSTCVPQIFYYFFPLGNFLQSVVQLIYTCNQGSKRCAAKSSTPQTRQAETLSFGELWTHLTDTRARNRHSCILETSGHSRVHPSLTASRWAESTLPTQCQIPHLPPRLCSPAANGRRGHWLAACHPRSLRSAQSCPLFGPVVSHVVTYLSHPIFL